MAGNGAVFSQIAKSSPVRVIFHESFPGSRVPISYLHKVNCQVSNLLITHAIQTRRTLSISFRKMPRLKKIHIEEKNESPWPKLYDDPIVNLSDIDITLGFLNVHSTDSINPMPFPKVQQVLDRILKFELIDMVIKLILHGQTGNLQSAAS